MLNIHEYIDELLENRRENIYLQESYEDKEITMERVNKIGNYLNQNYLAKIVKLYNTILSKYPVVKSSKMNRIGSNNNKKLEFTYYKIQEWYSIELMMNNLKIPTEEEKYRQFEQEILLFYNDIRKDLKALGFTISPNIPTIKRKVKEAYRYVGYNYYFGYINFVIEPTETFVKNFKDDTEVSVNFDSKTKIKYCKLYDQFVNFIRRPHVLTNNDIFFGEINDMCYILDISHIKYMQLFSANIKKQQFQKGSWETFDNPDSANFLKICKRTIGDFYNLQSNSYTDKELLYSINKNKIYLIDWEHEELSIFPNSKYASNMSSTFAKEVSDNVLKAAVKKFLIEYDKSKGYNLLQ